MPRMPIRHYGKAFQLMPLPNLMETQCKFYAEFLQLDVPASERKNDGLEAVFREVFPIESYDGSIKLEYLEYQIGEPRHTPDECRALRLTYAGPLKIKVRLTSKVVLEEWVYIGEIPLMIGGGEFIVNGAERVIVTQLQRSPGVDFASEKHASGKTLHSCRIIPERGSWIQIEVTSKDVLTVRIDRSGKIAATTFLRAIAPELGLTGDILRTFYATSVVELTPRNAAKIKDAVCVSEVVNAETGEAVVASGARLTEFALQQLRNLGVDRIEVAGRFAETGDFESIEDELILNTLKEDDTSSHEDALKRIYARLRPGAPVSADKARDFLDERFFDEKRYNFGPIGRFRMNRKFGVGEDDRQTLGGVDLVSIFNYLLKLREGSGVVDDIDHLENRRVRTIKDLVMTELRNAMIKLRRTAREQIVIKGVGEQRAKVSDVAGFSTIHHEGERPKLMNEAMAKAFQKKAANQNIDLKKRVLARFIVNNSGSRRGIKTGQIIDEAVMEQAMAEDAEFAVTPLPMPACLILEGAKAKYTPGDVIDEDAFEAAQALYGAEAVIGLPLSFEKDAEFDVEVYKRYRAIYGDMPGVSLEMVRPHQLLNASTVSSAIDYFFARGELSQVVDQNNPLSQLVHERRLSALGPGGLNRKRAGFDVRDVHTSHYGRICPVETPEGSNIGLIVSLANYSAVNDLGFLITPYYRVKDRRITNELVWLRADEEGGHYIAQSDVRVDEHGAILVERPICRHQEEFMHCDAGQVTLIDVAPKQLVGISAALIPFLEHDDANRALMGSNMQRQAVPLVRPDVPRVGTQMEVEIVRNSGMVARAVEDGTVLYADALEVRVSSEELIDGARIYKLHKYKGLNDGTTLNQTPLVRPGDKVRKGDPLSEGAATADGCLALGKNTMVAFISWEGCNFEDAILVSERLIADDAFTSVHIEEFACEIRETKVGLEEITRDIPGVSEAMLANLDEDGLIRVGTRVKQGDILVGKIAPKAKSEFSSEEKLLRAIFGRVGEDVKNDSLTVPPGTEGYIINVKRFSRRLPKGEDPASTRKQIAKIESEARDRVVEEVKLKFKRLEEFLGGEIINKRTGKVLRIPRNPDYERLMELQEQSQWGDIEAPEAKRPRAKAICQEHDRRVRFIETRRDVEVGRLRRGDELRPGVLEYVKVYVAVKRKLSLGDKMAGRHGNKGVVARILPEEDIPFLADGTAVQMILNPLGVPSRMNVGQILETHLGWAADTLGFRAVTPVFDGASEADIHAALKEAGLPEDGKAVLYDGRTGEPFHEPVTVGVMYMIKLHHLVAEKIHARATGPYSLITQQPLGGKARNGGQRFGEMEVWAIEAYGASSILQELLTVKSDDVAGRTKIYEAMVKGDTSVEPGMPVSFDVLCNEIRGLGLNIRMSRD